MSTCMWRRIPVDVSKGKGFSGGVVFAWMWTIAKSTFVGVGEW